MGVAMTPYGTVDGKKIVRTRLASGYNAFINNYGKYPEFSYLVLQALHAPTTTKIQVRLSESNIDPYCYSHFEDPELRAGDWEFKVPGAAMFLDTLKASLDIGVPELVIPGHGKYTEAFEINLTSYLAGEMSATKALDDSTKRWNEITEDLGFDNQQFYYKELAKHFPP